MHTKTYTFIYFYQQHLVLFTMPPPYYSALWRARTGLVLCVGVLVTACSCFFLVVVYRLYSFSAEFVAVFYRYTYIYPSLTAFSLTSFIFFVPHLPLVAVTPAYRGPSAGKGGVSTSASGSTIKRTARYINKQRTHTLGKLPRSSCCCRCWCCCWWCCCCCCCWCCCCSCCPF